MRDRTRAKREKWTSRKSQRDKEALTKSMDETMNETKRNEAKGERERGKKKNDNDKIL